MSTEVIYGPPRDVKLKKYYWIVWQCYGYPGTTNHTVSENHPFVWLKSDSIVILNWKEISKAEYDLFNA